MNSGMKSETKAISKYSVKEILAEEPYHLMELFRNEYGYDIPETIDTVEDMRIDRKNVIDTFGEAVGLKYKAISRMLTIKQQINEELKMTDGR